MWRPMVAGWTVLLVASFVQAGQKPNQQQSAPAEQYRTLLQEYRQVRRPQEFAGRFIQLAQKNPKDPVATHALVWVVTNLRSGAEVSQAVQILTTDHIANSNLGGICEKVERRPSLSAEKLLRAVLEKSPHPAVKAQACVSLASYLKRELSLIDSMKTQPASARRMAQFYGKDYTEHLASLDEAAAGKEIERLYERILESFADLQISGAKLGEFAEQELFVMRHLSVGKTPPEIEGEDIAGQPLKLSDYRGKVVLLDFWGHW